MAKRIPPKPARHYESYLKTLTKNVAVIISEIDGMAKQLDGSAGKRIARLVNALEYENDRARYFGLGIDFRTDKKRTAASHSPRNSGA